MEQKPMSDRWFRYTIGFLCLTAGIGGFAGLYFISVPSVNRDALMFALGNIFGWGALVVASEFGASKSGQKLVDSALGQLERDHRAPTGSPTDPLSIAGSAVPAPPVETTLKQKRSK